MHHCDALEMQTPVVKLFNATLLKHRKGKEQGQILQLKSGDRDGIDIMDIEGTCKAKIKIRSEGEKEEQAFFLLLEVI